MQDGDDGDVDEDGNEDDANTNRQSHHVEPSAKVKSGKGDLIQQNHRGARTNILTEGRDSQDAVIVYREIFQLALPCSVPK